MDTLNKLTRFLIVYESEAENLKRLAAAGITGEPATEIAGYLAQTANIRAFESRIKQVFAKQGIVVGFHEVGDTAGYITSLQRDPARTMLWNVTGGFAFYRASFTSSTAHLLGASTFGSPPQAQHLAQDKFKTNALAHQLGIKTPALMLVRDGESHSPKYRRKHGSRLLVRPNALGTNIGVSAESVCNTWEEAVGLSRQIWSRYRDSAIVQTYIEEGDDVRVFFMDCAAEDERSKLGIYRLEAADDNLTNQVRLIDLQTDHNPNAREIVQAIKSAVSQMQQLFGLRDYFSFDFRVATDGTPYFLDFAVCPAVTAPDFQHYLTQTYGIDLAEGLRRAVDRKTA